MIRDEQRAEAAKLKNAPFKEKFSYFFTYYKIPVIAILAVLFFAVSITRSILNANQPKLYVVITDQQGYEPDTQMLTAQYEANSQTPLPVSYDTSLELDLAEKNQANYIYHEKLLALYSANVVDVFIAPRTVFESYGAEEMFCPLDTVLSEEELSVLEKQGRILYVTLKDYSDPDHPAEGETVPAGVRLDGSALAGSCGLRTDNTFLGITYNTVQPTEALAYLRMFL